MMVTLTAAWKSLTAASLSLLVLAGAGPDLAGLKV
jgi:hypothetical protein